MHRLAAVLLLPLLALNARAQDVREDSIRTDSLATATVTATRLAISAHRAPARVTVLDARDVDATGAATVADVLEDRSAVFLKRYGPDGLASFSLRGSGASHTLVTLDGHRISDPQLGQLDPSLLPAVLLERAEVLHGSASSLYGTDAVGGVVALSTPRALRPTLKLRGGTGAFGERTASGLLAGPVRSLPLTLTLAADASASRGDYAYVDSTAFDPETLTSGVTRARQNSDVARRSGFARLALQTDRHRAALGLLLTDAERGLFDYAASQSARQNDRALRLWADHTGRVRGWRVISGGAVQRAALGYQNPSLGLDTEGRTRVASVQSRAERSWGLAGGAWTLAMGGSLGTGTADHPNLAREARETQTAAFASLVADHDRWLASAALRYDRSRTTSADTLGAARALSPSLGVNVQPTAWRGLRVKASLGRAFRTPTFNDRFWQPGGNPDLRPERGWTAETGLSAELTSGAVRLAAEATAFASELDDRIVWRYERFADGAYWAPFNVGRVVTRGGEVSVSARWTAPHASAELGGLWTRSAARDRTDPEASSFGQPLLYVPDEQAKAFAAARWRFVSADVTVRHAGRRFTRTDGGASLPPYTVADAQVSLLVSGADWRSRLSVRVDNLADATYSVIPRFPMPPRHVRLALSLTLL